MPTVPKYTKCSQLGCNNPRSKLLTSCIEHGGRDTHIYNPKTNQREDRKANGLMYKTRQWEALRQIQLSKHPLCAGCMAEGIVTAANTVDHLFPWTQISKQAFYINRFQSLCPTHHATKTQLEQHGIYRAFGTPTIDYARSDYARIMGVLDPSDSETLL